MWLWKDDLHISRTLPVARILFPTVSLLPLIYYNLSRRHWCFSRSPVARFRERESHRALRFFLPLFSPFLFFPSLPSLFFLFIPTCPFPRERRHYFDPPVIIFQFTLLHIFLFFSRFFSIFFFWYLLFRVFFFSLKRTETKKNWDLVLSTLSIHLIPSKIFEISIGRVFFLLLYLFFFFPFPFLFGKKKNSDKTIRRTFTFVRLVQRTN